MTSHAPPFRKALAERKIMPLMGVFDAFSATIAANHFDSIFLSGFGFAASYLGLPDVGFISWTDMLAYVERMRRILPDHHIVVDIDDGYGDPEVAAHVASRLEWAGASAVVLEDQRRPRRCGHVDGKQVLELDEYLAKLRMVLDAREDLFVVARTDSTGAQEQVRRIKAFAEAGADAVLVDGIPELPLLEELSSAVDVPLAFNQIAGGKSPPASLAELEALGVGLVIYSTPCLFAAQEAMEAEMQRLKADDGRLPAGPDHVGVSACNTLMKENLSRTRPPPRHG